MYDTTTWLSVCDSSTMPLSWTTHMPSPSVQWPECQLCCLGWAAGIVSFMLIADGARRDARLIKGTGMGGGMGGY